KPFGFRRMTRDGRVLEDDDTRKVARIAKFIRVIWYNLEMKNGDKIGIIGFGLEGQSVYRWLIAKGINPDLIYIHDQNLVEGYQGVFGSDYLWDLDQYNYAKIYRSPGVRLDQEIKTSISSATIEFFKDCPANIIGVTGTKGKGTTASLIMQILQLSGKNSYLVGNIGNPALDILNQLTPDDWVIYELSSYQLSDLRQSPQIAICLMLGLDHLDWHLDQAEYYQAKSNIFRYQSSQDLAVYKADDPNSSRLVELSPAVWRGYGPVGTSSLITYDNQGIYFEGKLKLPRAEILLPGMHNLENIAAAVSATWEVVKDKSVYQLAAKKFAGLSHHIEFVAEVDSVKYYDDSFATNPAATVAAIKALAEFGDKLVVMLGGRDKALDYSQLAKLFTETKQVEALIYGQDAIKIKQAFDQAKATNYQLANSQDFGQVVSQARLIAENINSRAVLLSPATSSLDMFANYKDRGDQFQSAVKGFVAKS
ncbi:UDP-N-acetylmuramoyl-L-alanine--D-glutamate ligase, partial [Candidatus Saccharibacteria bacterium]|nr:UDP-N-acetylmuramoyl-L-alanine--D-glutamate ligase [Candidatus Saccharibacteria bacterium]